ncbi:hypothetical protein ACGFS9_32375 [Streptomyces sp. NPDC048566]|uniref:hypothetical protein n=1 Tax=Streptomyces sp. NPDC048566 TaxID=3365569 RepID=UPI003711AC27
MSLLAVGMAFLAACGTETAGRGGGDGASAQGPIPWTTMQPSAVTGVRLGADGRTLSLATRVPRGPRACYHSLKAVLGEPGDGIVRVQVTFTSPSQDRGSGCTEEGTATARVTLPEPLGDRDVIVDNYTHFTAEGAEPPALRLCGELGCTPPATGCTTASYEQALMAVDAPMHTYRDDERCDGKWLVLDISWRTGPACGDSTDPACSSRLGDRWFLRATKAGWEPIVRTAAGGCADVRRREPAFPSALCASLEPLPASLHPTYAPSSPAATPGASGNSG